MSIRSRFRLLLLLCGLMLAIASEAVASKAPSGPQTARLVLISDLDDTAKITHVAERSESMWNALFSRRAFTGMAEVYRLLKQKNPDMEFVYLSASPDVLAPWVHGFLSDNRFPPGHVILRKTLDSRTIADYKLTALLDYIRLFPDPTQTKFILVGDDTQADAHVYYSLKLKFPNLIAEMFIRKIRGIAIPREMIPLVSAFDLAREQYRVQRLDEPALERLAHLMLSDPDDEKLLPSFQYCDRGATPTLVEERILELDRQITDRIVRICRDRYRVNLF